MRIFCAASHLAGKKFSIAHQFARIAVLQSGADALRQAQRNALEGHNGFILPRRGLRIDVAPAIPFLRFLLRQLEGALRRGKGDNRLMLPAVPLIVQFRQAHADARKAHLAEQGLQSQRKQPQLFIPLPQRMACVPLQANSPGGGSYRGGLPVLQRRKREFTDLIAWRRERIDRRSFAQPRDKEPSQS